MTEPKKPAPKYIYELADASGAIRYVEARSKEQAIAHVFKPIVKTLSARDAVSIARSPNIVIEVAGEVKPLDQPELPLVAPQCDGEPQAATSTEPAAIVEQDAVQTPAAPKPGLFGRKSA